MTRRLKWLRLAAGALVMLGAGAAAQTLPGPQARPPVDAPELAKLGQWSVGVVEEEIVQPRQIDPVHGGAVSDRHLPLTIWYPAAAAGPGTTYHTALSGENGVDVPFDVAGIATPRAAVTKGRFPLVILAHGYGNTPATLSWLGENLASKGYIVVAPAFRDPPISIRTAVAHSGPIARRPLDIVFLAAELRRHAQAGHGVFAAADADRMALIGYSMGGYGVLTAAGAPLDPRFRHAIRRGARPVCRRRTTCQRPQGARYQSGRGDLARQSLRSGVDLGTRRNGGGDRADIVRRRQPRSCRGL